MVHPKPSRFLSFLLWMVALGIGIIFWGFLIVTALKVLSE